MHLRLIERNMVRTVHWFEHVGIILRRFLLALHYWEHALAIVVPVLRCLVQTHLAEVRSPDVLIAIFLLRLADIALHLVAQRLAIRQEQWHASGYLVAYNE